MQKRVQGEYMNIHDLLEKASEVVAQSNSPKELTGADYNIFSVLKVERKEVGTHSRVLFSLLSPNGAHQQKDKYLKLFLQGIDVPLALREMRWQVEREWTFFERKSSGRIDFLLHCPKMCIAIEMKIDALDGDAQLFRYEQYAMTKADAYRICYLTLLGSPPSEQSSRGLKEENFQLLSFSGHILRWLAACLEVTPVSSSAYSFIQQYMSLIKRMTEEESMSEQIGDLIQGADHLRGAIAISNELNNIKAEVMGKLFARIKNECEALGLYSDHYDDYSAEFYDKGRYASWLCYVVKDYGNIGRSKKKKAVVLSIFVPCDLRMAVELVEIPPDGDNLDKGEWGFMSQEQFGKKATRDVNAALESLYGELEVDAEYPNILHWEHVLDSNEEEFDFGQFSESCIRLRDKDHLQREARRIAEKMVVEYQRIREALTTIL